MPRPLKRGILGASTIVLSKDVGKYAFMCGSIFYETDFKMEKLCYAKFVVVKPINIDSVSRFQPTTF